MHFEAGADQRPQNALCATKGDFLLFIHLFSATRQAGDCQASSADPQPAQPSFTPPPGSTCVSAALENLNISWFSSSQNQNYGIEGMSWCALVALSLPTPQRRPARVSTAAASRGAGVPAASRPAFMASRTLPRSRHGSHLSCWCLQR